MVATRESDGVNPALLEALPDGELIRMVKCGSDTALGVLLHRHRDALYRFCIHLVQNHDEAEDICQESMARAITRVDSLQSGSAFRSWLFSIARNLSIDAHRGRRRTVPMPDEEAGLLPLPLHADNPYERVETHEEYQTVTQALGKLKKNHQTVLLLREVEGLSYAQIAEQLDVSQSAVETLLFRARKRLREEYGKAGAPVPAIAGLGGLRGFLGRLFSPLSGGASIAAKAGITAVLIGGAVMGVPHAIPVLHAASGGLVPGPAAPHIASVLPPRPRTVPVAAHQKGKPSSTTVTSTTHGVSHTHSGHQSTRPASPTSPVATSPNVTRHSHSGAGAKSGTAGRPDKGGIGGSSTTGTAPGGHAGTTAGRPGSATHARKNAPHSTSPSAGRTAGGHASRAGVTPPAPGTSGTSGGSGRGGHSGSGQTAGGVATSGGETRSRSHGGTGTRHGTLPVATTLATSTPGPPTVRGKPPAQPVPTLGKSPPATLPPVPHATAPVKLPTVKVVAPTLAPPKLSAPVSAPTVGLPHSTVTLPHPTLTVPKPTVGLPKPKPTVIVAPKPTVVVPKPTVGLPKPKPTVVVPKPTVHPTLPLPKPTVGLPKIP